MTNQDVTTHSDHPPDRSGGLPACPHPVLLAGISTGLSVSRVGVLPAPGQNSCPHGLDGAAVAAELARRRSPASGPRR